MRIDGRIKYKKIYETPAIYKVFNMASRTMGGEKHSSYEDCVNYNRWTGTDFHVYASFPICRIIPWYGDNFVE